VGQMAVLCVEIKAELQNLHARQPQPVPQRGDLRGNDPQILGNDGQVAQLLAHGGKERLARPFDPAPMLGGLLLGHDLPVGLEAPKMVDPAEVGHGQEVAQTGDPPAIKRLIDLALLGPPAVKRVAPALAGGTEIVWGNAGHMAGQEIILTQLEKAGVGPDVGTVVAHVDGQITDQPHPLGLGVLA